MKISVTAFKLSCDISKSGRTLFFFQSGRRSNGFYQEEAERRLIVNVWVFLVETANGKIEEKPGESGKFFFNSNGVLWLR